MTVEKCIRLMGETKCDAIKALKKVTEWVTRRPEDKDLYRHIYISLDMNNGENKTVSSGGYYGDNHLIRPDIDHIYSESQKVLDSSEIKHFFISGLISKDSEK